jgi:hypothetical protein
MPGGDLYLGKFRARSVDRLVRAFAGREQELVGAAAALGGRRVGFGDAAVEIPALPRVPVSVVLWAGDDEFPATGNLLFDAAVAGYLALEDMVVLAGMVASRLCGPSQGGGR